jgi:aryl-alcohol dehydrogenase-like predicted oxidoreductase
MNYRRLGRSGLKVSEISYGSWTTAGGKYPPEVSIACHKRAFELGINLFDTADVYQAGQAEEIVGQVVQSLPRNEVVIATKLGFGSDKGPNGRGASRKHVFESCHSSLRRLKTDRIDLYQLHIPDTDTPLDETCRAFDDLARQGKIIYWGVSNWSGHQIKDAVTLCQSRGFDQPASLQPSYSMFKRHSEKDEFPACAAHGLGVIVYSPLAQGVLTGKYSGGNVPSGSRASLNGESFRKHYFAEYNQIAVKELLEVAAAAGMPLTRLALAWVLANQHISSAIVGATSPAQIEETATASGVQLSPDVMSQIQKILDRRWALVLEDDARTLRSGAIA